MTKGLRARFAPSTGASWNKDFSRIVIWHVPFVPAKAPTLQPRQPEGQEKGASQVRGGPARARVLRRGPGSGASSAAR